MTRFLSILILPFIFCGFARAQSYAWAQQTSNTIEHLFGIYACTDDTVFAVGYTGTILKTCDGGTTWSSQVSSTVEDLYDVHFISTDTGYAVGDAGTALKTVDGGLSWTQMNVGTTVYFRNVHFVTPLIGFIGGGTSGPGSYGTIMRTTDGGNTWSNLSIGNGCFYGITFTSVMNGFMSSYTGQVYKTTDGGITWTGSSSGVSTILTGMASTPNGTTTFAVGINGNIRVTNDSGATWSAVASSATCDLGGMDFYDALNGVVSGGVVTPSSAIILTTADGGLTWTPSYPQVSRLTKLDMLHADLGYAVGISGTIIKYAKVEVGINESVTGQHSFMAFPNPFNSSTTIDCSQYTFTDNASLIVRDINGKDVRRSETAEQSIFVVEKAELPVGLYFYTVYDGEMPVGTGKLIVE